MGIRECSIMNLADTVHRSSLAKKRYCFILGSGASRQSGIKTGVELAREWLNEIKELEPNDYKYLTDNLSIDNNNAGEHYPLIYEKRFFIDPSSGYLRLQSEMDNKSPSCGYYHLSKILTETESNLVITTNFDSLTEDSIFIYTDKKPLVINHELLAKYIDVLISRPVIAKVHRDLLLQPKNTKDDVSNLSEEWKDVLNKALEIYTPIIIGYGGNDGSLMDFLENITLQKKQMYWCYMKRDGIPSERIQNLVIRYKGFFVPIDGFDETMVLLGEKFGHKFPDEYILGNANSRIEVYRDQVNNIKTALENKQDIKLLSETEEATVNALDSINSRQIDSLTKQISQNPHNHDTYYKRGSEYFKMKQYKNAVDDFTKAIEIAPNNAKYYNWRGASYNRLEEYEKAVNDRSMAIELDPNNANYYHARGINYNWLKEYEKAVADYSKAIELNPNIAAYYNDRGVSYNWLKDCEKAVADHSKAIELDPNIAGYYYERGINYHRLKEYEKAVADHSRAIELDPNVAMYYNERGVSYNWLKEYEKAVANHSKAIELDPKNAKYYNERRKNYNWLKEYDKAAADKAKAKELDPNIT